MQRLCGKGSLVTAHRQSYHRCFADGCERQISNRLLMCLDHWRLVDKAVQNEVWRTWRESDKLGEATPDYIQARLRAREATAKGEAQS